MPMGSPVDGFRLAYDHRRGSGSSVVLLHGWPGDRADWRAVLSLLPDELEVVTPDLRGFGGSDKHRREPDGNYDADSQARSVLALIDELDLHRPVIAGYDIGSRITQALARARPDLPCALVLSPPLPGAGRRILEPPTANELWYVGFHRSGLAEKLLDGHPERIREYLRDRYQQWSGPDFQLRESDLEHLVDVYSPPGAFAASIAWYRAGDGLIANATTEQAPAQEDRLTMPVRVLWQEFDPTFPRAFSDRLNAFFSDVTITLADGVGHFTPLEAPEAFAALITQVALE